MIPNDWKVKKMSDVVIWGSGGTPKATEATYYENGTIPWLIIGDLNDGVVNTSASKITELGLKNSSAKLIPPGTLLVAMYGSIGKLGITGMECCTNQAIAFAKELRGVTTKYIFYYLALMKSKLISMGKGGTQKNISQAVLKSLDVVVPPLSQQECIVARIEELLSQLDANVSELKTAKERLKVYRQAVLKEAFEGTLTKSEKLGYSILETYIEKPRYGTSKKCDYSKSNGSIAVYRIPNIDHRIGQISHQDIKYAEFSEAELAGLELDCGDILIIRSNGSASLVGRAALVKQIDTGGTFAGYLMRLRIKDKSLLVPEFLLYYLQSHLARVYIMNKAKSTSGVHNINSTEISGLSIPVFGIDDQRSIVATIESRLSVCDSIEKTVDTALQQAEALRQSILKKAFEGGMEK